jgi:hypothetical protein
MLVILFNLINISELRSAYPGGRAVKCVGFRLHFCWNYGFESRRGHGCWSLMSVLCCQIEISAKVQSLVQKSPTECV